MSWSQRETPLKCQSSPKALCHFDSVSRQIHITDCGVWLSGHLIGLLIKDVVDKEHNGQDCVAEARSGLHAAAKGRKRRWLWHLTDSCMKTTNWKHRLLNLILLQFCLFSYQWCGVLRNHCFTLLWCHFQSKHEENNVESVDRQWGKKGREIAKMPYFPLTFMWSSCLMMWASLYVWSV